MVVRSASSHLYDAVMNLACAQMGAGSVILHSHYEQCNMNPETCMQTNSRRALRHRNWTRLDVALGHIGCDLSRNLSQHFLSKLGLVALPGGPTLEELSEGHKLDNVPLSTLATQIQLYHIPIQDFHGWEQGKHKGIMTQNPLDPPFSFLPSHFPVMLVSSPQAQTWSGSLKCTISSIYNPSSSSTHKPPPSCSSLLGLVTIAWPWRPAGCFLAQHTVSLYFSLHSEIIIFIIAIPLMPNSLLAVRTSYETVSYLLTRH